MNIKRIVAESFSRALLFTGILSLWFLLKWELALGFTVIFISIMAEFFIARKNQAPKAIIPGQIKKTEQKVDVITDNKNLITQKEFSEITKLPQQYIHKNVHYKNPPFKVVKIQNKSGTNTRYKIDINDALTKGYIENSKHKKYVKRKSSPRKLRNHDIKSLEKEILNYITACSDKGVSLTDISRSFNHLVSTADRREILLRLIEEGKISQSFPSGGFKPKTIYKVKKTNEAKIISADIKVIAYIKKRGEEGASLSRIGGFCRDKKISLDQRDSILATYLQLGKIKQEIIPHENNKCPRTVYYGI